MLGVYICYVVLKDVVAFLILVVVPRAVRIQHVVQIRWLLALLIVSICLDLPLAAGFYGYVK